MSQSYKKTFRCNITEFDRIQIGDRIILSEMPLSQKHIDNMRIVEGVVSKLGEGEEDSWITLEHSENDSQEEEDNIVGREVPWFRNYGYSNWMYTIQKCSIPLTPRDIHRRELTGSPLKKRRLDFGIGKIIL